MRVRIAAGALVALVGCKDDLSVGGVEVADAGGVVVRLRPVCGNAEVEDGEECDDGANGDDGDGCSDACQRPCGEGEIAVVACGAGRELVEEGTVRDVQTNERVPYRLEHRTTVCRRDDGRTIELVTCTKDSDKRVCVNAVPPPEGGHLCQARCNLRDPCGRGEVCALLYREPLESLTGRLDGYCMPIVGGRAGDQCESNLHCGPGLRCNHVLGTRSRYQCSPIPEGSRCADRSCPSGFSCRGSVARRTNEETGIACFPSLQFRTGTRVTAEQAAGCVGFQLGDRGQRYCSESCDDDRDCPQGFFCGEATGADGNSFGACAFRDASALRDPPPFDPVPEFRPADGCDTDVSPACTHGSDCDPDCEERAGCGLVSVGGQCDANVLRYCNDQRVMEADCAARGLRCAFDVEQARYDCVGKE